MEINAPLTLNLNAAACDDFQNKAGLPFYGAVRCRYIKFFGASSVHSGDFFAFARFIIAQKAG
jgi:hypothetical protein